MEHQGIRDYVRRVAETVEAVLGADHQGIYLVGSLVHGDFAAHRSDIDVLVVADDPLSEETKRDMVARLDHDRLPCPALGLDLGVFLRETVSRPPPVPAYELALSTGATWPREVSESGVEPGVLVDFAVCRAKGRSLAGPPSKQVFGEVPRKVLRDAMKGEIAWASDHVHHPFHDPRGHFGVLNACRAWRYLEEGSFCSKSEGGEWALQQQPSWKIIADALAIRRGALRKKLARDRVQEFIERVAERF